MTKVTLQLAESLKIPWVNPPFAWVSYIWHWLMYVTQPCMGALRLCQWNGHAWEHYIYANEMVPLTHSYYRAISSQLSKEYALVASY